MKNKRTELAAYYGENLLFIDPPEDFDCCIAGIGVSCSRDPVVIYNTNKIVEALILQGMSEEQAYEHMEVNIVGAYVGEHTPIFLFQE